LLRRILAGVKLAKPVGACHLTGIFDFRLDDRWRWRRPLTFLLAQ